MSIYTSPYPDIDLPTDNRSLYQILEEKIDLHGEKIAVIENWTGKSYTYKELKLLIRQAACGLYQYGLRHGDIILIAAHNCLEYLLVEFGALAIGCVVSSTTPKLTTLEMKRILGIARCQGTVRFIFTNSQSYECVKSMPEDEMDKIRVFCFDDSTGCNPFSDLLKSDITIFENITADAKATDAATLFFSSGTTGAPKGILCSQYFYISCVFYANVAADYYLRDVTLTVSPFFHIFSFALIRASGLYMGASIVIIPNYNDVKVVLEMIQNYQVTELLCSPAFLIALLQGIVEHGDQKLSSLRMVYSGGVGLHPSIAEKYSERFPYIQIRQGYGMTEVGGIAVQSSGYSSNDGRTVLLPNVKAKIVDRETGKSLEPGYEGEILVKCPSMMITYLNNSEEFARSFTDDGFFRTGDVGTFDKEGKLLIIDRIKNMIKVYNRKELISNQVLPVEIETVLTSHPDVADAAVVGIDDPDAPNYELLRAYVVKKNSNLSEEDIICFVKDHLSETKWLMGGVKFMNVLPRSGLGKVQRHLLLAEDKSLNK